MPEHYYRITVDKLDTGESPTGEGGLESISFFASTQTDILAAANTLRNCLNCSASNATRLAIGLGLLSESIRRRHPTPDAASLD